MGARELGQAALRLLNADPTASMAQIATAAGISRATLHRTFATREDLVKFLGRMSLESWRDALDAAGIDEAAADGNGDKVTDALHRLCGELIRDADEYGFVLTEPAAHRDEELVTEAELLQNRELRFYTAAQEAGVLRADLPVPWIANAVFGLLVGLRDGLRRGDIAVRDAERLLRETLLNGVSAR